MTKINCRAVLFDMDGVLVDSTPAVARVWGWWAQQHGFDTEDTIRRAHGRPSLTTIRELLPNSDHEAENNEVERREIEDTEGVIPLPGAMELLTTLPKDRWTIATSCTRDLAHVRIKEGGLPIPKNLITADDVRIGKPDPEPYIKAATLLGFSPQDCVVVEDAPAGISAGKAAGSRVLAVRTTATDAELVAAGADWIVTDLASVTFEPSNAAGQLTLILKD
jgi:mannitol-1-/sugar-/sorbitol-6-phosphatase